MLLDRKRLKIWHPGDIPECDVTRDLATRGPSGSSLQTTTTGRKRSSRTSVLPDDIDLDRKRIRSIRGAPTGSMVPNEKGRTTSDAGVSTDVQSAVVVSNDAPT